MGNWRNRTPRRFFNRHNHYQAPNERPRASHSSFAEDGVPSWEKRFCSSIGCVPWWKVVEAKTFTCGNNNILSWDDLAGKEAFLNAKNRFWAKIHGKSCDSSLPDQDVYIDEVDWAPNIDPELVNDVERVYFAPAEQEVDMNAGRQIKKLRRLLSFTTGSQYGNMNGHNSSWEHNENKIIQVSVAQELKEQGWEQLDTHLKPASSLDRDDNPQASSISPVKKAADCELQETCAQNPWECNNSLQGDVGVQERKPDWNQLDAYVKPASNLKSDDNPWECSVYKENKTVEKNTWGAHNGNSWECNNLLCDVSLKNKTQGWNNWETRGKPASDLKSDVNKPPESCVFHCNEAVKGSTWRDCKNNSCMQTNSSQCDVSLNKMQGWNQRDTHKNNNENSWDRSSSQGKETLKSNCWGDCENIWGQNQADLVTKSKDWEVKGNTWENCTQKNKAWANPENDSWNCKKQEFGKSDGWGQSCEHTQRTGFPKDRWWADPSKSSLNWKERQWYHEGPKDREPRRSTTGWGAWDDDCRKEETRYRNMTTYGNNSHEKSHHQAKHYWKRKK